MAFVTYSCEDGSIRGQQEKKKSAVIDDVKQTQSMQWGKEKKKKSLSGMMIYLLSCHSK